ncbi:MAG: hypothetical protein GY930_07110 [bacterium]|nr:hypothetical protein [bacterium]
MNSESFKFGSDGGQFTEEFLEGLALDLVLETRTEEQVVGDGVPKEQAGLRELLEDPAFVARVEELRSWIGETRECLGDWKGDDDAVAPSLVPGILTASTRAKEAGLGVHDSTSLSIGVWGDAKVLFGFVRRRMASSVALRLAAASLLAHLIALPALAAYIYWQRPEAEPLTIRFDPTQPVVPDEMQEQAPDEVLAGDADLWSALGLDEANAIAGAHYRLSHGDWAGANTKLEEPLGSWVGVRLERLADDADRVPVAAVPVGQEACLGHVLALDLALDDWLFGRRSGGFGEEWFAPLTELVTRGKRDSDLALAALARAQAYGLLAPSNLPDGVQDRLQATDFDRRVLGGWWFDLMRNQDASKVGELPIWSAWFRDQR